MVKKEEVVKLRFRDKHKFLYSLFLLIILVGIIIAGFQLFNYLRFILGFDLTLRLGVDNNDLNLANGQEIEINFNIEKVSSILCVSECYYKFIDLSQNIILDSNSFAPIQGIVKAVPEKIITPLQGEGQKVYAFDVSCRNIPSDICQTLGNNVSRRQLVTLEYFLSKEQIEKKQSFQYLIYQNYYLLDYIEKVLSKNILQAQEEKLLLKEQATLNNLHKTISNILNKSLLSWENQNYQDININELEKDINNSRIALVNLSFSLNHTISVYNQLIEDIFLKINEVNLLKEVNLNETQSQILENIVKEYNSALLLFYNEGDLIYKINTSKIILSIPIPDFENQSMDFIFNFTEINSSNLIKIEPISFLEDSFNILEMNITLPENNKICCLSNLCQTCKIQEKYPVVLLYGHNFNEDISADNIMNGLGVIQEELETLGYLNAGEFFLYEKTRNNPGTLGTITKPIVVRASYYFDVLEKPHGYESIQIQSQNMDTYAIRLRDIIENLKYETKSSKVIIISHSMGGLVVRRYIQIFGKENIDKIVMIGTPNLGLDEKIGIFCRTFGAVQECADLDSNSLFINKLNSEDFQLPPAYNIIGTGCEMVEGIGDGVVLENNAVLKESPYVKNFFLNGTCSGVDLFHNSILDVHRYPEVFTIIKEALKD